MKIKKIKSQGEYCYPATIAAAVKDANFLKEDDSPMTLGEINLYLNNSAVKTVNGYEPDANGNVTVSSSQDNNIAEEQFLLEPLENITFADDDENEIYAQVTPEGVFAKAYYDLDGNPLDVTPTKEMALMIHPLYNKKVYVMGTSNDNGWPTYLNELSGAIWEASNHNFVNKGGTFAGDIGGYECDDPLFGTDHAAGGSLRARNFVKLSESTADNPDYLFLNSQNNDLAVWDEFHFYIISKVTTNGNIIVRGGSKSLVIVPVTTSMATNQIASAIVTAVNNANVGLYAKNVSNKLVITIKIGNQADIMLYNRTDDIFIDDLGTGLIYSMRKVSKEDIIKDMVDNADPLMYSLYKVIDTPAINATEVDTWFANNIDTVLANFEEAKSYSVVHLQYHTYTKDFTFSGTATAGTITVNINGESFNTLIDAGSTPAQVVSKVYTDIAEEFANTAWNPSTNSNVFSLKFTKPNNGSTSDTITIDASGVGMTVVTAENDTVAIRPLCFMSRDLTKFNDSSYWKYLSSSSNYVEFMKGIIEYIQTNKPFSKIVLYQTPSKTFYRTRLRADGTYDLESQKRAFRELTFGENKEIFMKYLGEYYGIQYINTINEITGIANWESLYDSEGNVHFNNKMAKKIAEVIVNNVH